MLAYRLSLSLPNNILKLESSPKEVLCARFRKILICPPSFARPSQAVAQTSVLLPTKDVRHAVHSKPWAWRGRPQIGTPAGEIWRRAPRPNPIRAAETNIQSMPQPVEAFDPRKTAGVSLPSDGKSGISRSSGKDGDKEGTHGPTLINEPEIPSLPDEATKGFSGAISITLDGNIAYGPNDTASILRLLGYSGQTISLRLPIEK